MSFEDLVLIKLGGSLITDKSGVAAIRRDRIERLAAEIAALWSRRHEDRGGPVLLLGHGSGSFGHAAAAAHAVGTGPLRQPGELLGAARTGHEAARLHREVVESLVEAGVPAFSFAASSALIARCGRPVSGTIAPLLALLEGGWLPVVYGDVVTDREWGASVCSTESIFLYLARRLHRRGVQPRRAVWLGLTDGILDASGATVPEVGPEQVAAVRQLVGGSAGTDVTGGMVLRLEAAVALADLGIESLILDGRRPEILAAAVRGECDSGTRVFGAAAGLGASDESA